MRGRPMRYLLRALLFTALECFLSRAIVPLVGPVCGWIGATALSYAVVQHVAIDWTLDLVEEKRRLILHGLGVALNWFIGYAIVLSPLWIPLLLPNKFWLRLGVGFVLGCAMLLLIGNLKERESTEPKAR
jgi:hypothetical protein